ncbi:Maf-like protein [Maribacter cobaltidurans]|uniref:dTTP/UTP pyrophosphatase n=1 Tax=Maribacter cobaltidurans TaxID=1178778 RepID=A0A223VAI9_9FLAO|nr:Maf-like protein [Maribacter cobaltidurans]ASV32302.1 septum formation protein Maf [Maribacter cobaltidurans]GGD94822.1 Maf-like protein [Maribacter cobaltidurans]
MLKELLKDYRLILASGSPRRKQFFEEMGLNFEIRLRPVEEVYPSNLKGSEISDYLSKLKASAFEGQLKPMEILITSDTVVWYNDTSLAKASDANEAFEMISQLSGDWHEVITSVCFTTTERQSVKNSITKVKFKDLTDAEINYYIKNYQPFDKAGAYGIQEWIGLIGIEQIQGSYTNVVGLPTQMVYETLQDMVDK